MANSLKIISSGSLNVVSSPAPPPDAKPADPNAPLLQITDRAAAQVRSLLEKEGQPDGVFRVGVKTGGCSGMTYQMSIDDQPHEKDLVLRHDGIEVIVDPASLDYIRGTVMDFEGDVMSQKFTFKNPNATGACGCGISFSV